MRCASAFETHRPCGCFSHPPARRPHWGSAGAGQDAASTSCLDEQARPACSVRRLLVPAAIISDSTLSRWQRGAEAGLRVRPAGVGLDSVALTAGDTEHGRLEVELFDAGQELTDDRKEARDLFHVKQIATRSTDCLDAGRGTRTVTEPGSEGSPRDVTNAVVLAEEVRALSTPWRVDGELRRASSSLGSADVGDPSSVSISKALRVLDDVGERGQRQAPR